MSKLETRIKEIKERMKNVKKFSENYAQVNYEGLNKFGKEVYSADTMKALRNREMVMSAFNAGIDHSRTDIEFLIKILEETKNCLKKLEITLDHEPCTYLVKGLHTAILNSLEKIEKLAENK